MGWTSLLALVRRAATPVAVLVLVLSVIAPVRADTKGELARAKAKLQRLLDDMEGLDRRIDAMQDEMNELAGRMSAVQGEIAVTRDQAEKVRSQIHAAQRRLRATQRQLDRRAAVAYRNGPGSGLDFLLGSTSLADLNDRLEIINGAARSDQDLINEIQDRKNQLNIKRLELEQLERELRGKEAALSSESAALEQRFADQQEALESIEEQKAEAQDLIEQLEAKRAKEIAAEKARLEALREEREEREQAAEEEESPPPEETGDSGGDTGGSPPVVSAGGPFQVCPVDPPRAYSNDFGAPRVGHTHQGNDIFAPYGTPIRAPFPGTASSSNSSLGGLSVYVHGSQGFVYNAHLSSLGTLGSVSTGTIIGYVGDSGNAQGTSPHNHFEWHPGGGGAVNPYPYLNQVC